MVKPVLLTGFRPTGDLHLGHYFSLIEPIMQHQDEFKIFVLIADLHAQTELRKQSQINYQIFRSQIDHNIDSAVNAIGHFVNVDNLVIFRQSDLMSYHYDLFYKLLMVSKHHMTFGNPVFMDAMRSEYERDIESLKLDPKVKRLLRQFIDANPEALWGNITDCMAQDFGNLVVAEGLTVSKSAREKIVKYLNTRTGVIGLATYPILMAADIMLYNPTHVLVGTDQAPHLQITNDLVKVVNNVFGTKLARVEPMICHAQTLKGNDGRKMSKTFDNHLPLEYLLDTHDEQGESWFMKLRTFPRLKGQSGLPTECLAGEYSRLFSVNMTSMERCAYGDIGCVECKRNLFGEVRTQLCEKTINSVISCSVSTILERGRSAAQERIEQNTQLMNLLM